ncbi:MAG: hypothetical protein LBG46_02985, partial [Elusimicrobiota bacterium]|nr:hypothetical protein [Elusimicrobiota bacterium]
GFVFFSSFIYFIILSQKEDLGSLFPLRAYARSFSMVGMTTFFVVILAHTSLFIVIPPTQGILSLLFALRQTKQDHKKAFVLTLKSNQKNHCEVAG